MAKEKICGFIVVRKPQFATTEMIKPNLQLQRKTYRGLDRLPWEDLELAYYDRKLPSSLVGIWSELAELNKDLSGIRVLKNYDHARSVLEFSRDHSEIIAIWSSKIEQLKGSYQSEVEVSYLGLDCIGVSTGSHFSVEWSVLLAGIYAKPEYFRAEAACLNDHGLLACQDECDAVFRKYVELSRKEIVEPLMPTASGMSVKIFAAN